MSKTQRRNNPVRVTHVTDLLATGRALSPREQVRCDLPPVAQTPVDAAKLAFDRKMADALLRVAEQMQCAADALRHSSDSEGGDVD